MLETVAIANARTRTLALRDARGRFVTRGSALPKAPRVRSLAASPGRARILPSRDARGRFVAFPTTNAPSWYVLCADGYRIPGEPEVMRTVAIAPVVPQPLPPARVVRRRRPVMRRDELVTWLLMLLFIVVVGWYGLHLPPPHH